MRENVRESQQTRLFLAHSTTIWGPTKWHRLRANFRNTSPWKFSSTNTLSRRLVAVDKPAVEDALAVEDDSPLAAILPQPGICSKPVSE